MEGSVTTSAPIAFSFLTTLADGATFVNRINLSVPAGCDPCEVRKVLVRRLSRPTQISQVSNRTCT